MPLVFRHEDLLFDSFKIYNLMLHVRKHVLTDSELSISKIQRTASPNSSNDQLLQDKCCLAVYSCMSPA